MGSKIIIKALLGLIIITVLAIDHQPKPRLTQLHLSYIQDTIQIKRPAKIYLEYKQLPGLIQALTRAIGKHQYLIEVSPEYRDQEHTIMHELIHVKQIHTKALTQIDTEWYWYGQTIDWNQTYTERPWEQRAEFEAYFYEFCYKHTQKLRQVD